MRPASQLTRLSAICAGLLACAFALLVLAVRTRWEPLLRLDHQVLDSLHNHALHKGGFVDAMHALSSFGAGLVYTILFALIAAWLAWQRRLRLAMFVVVTMIGSSVINALAKLAVGRPRPVLSDPIAHAHGLSFPSGHAQSATVACGVLLVVFWPSLRGVWRVAATLLGAVVVSAIGFSRAALGVHFVSDVIGGYCLGGLWLALMITLLRPR